MSLKLPQMRIEWTRLLPVRRWVGVFTIMLTPILAAACAALPIAQITNDPLLPGDSAPSATHTADPPAGEQGENASPNTQPLPTSPPVIDATAAPPPFNLATPAIVIEQPEEYASPTPIPASAVLPPASIRIFRPGPGSHVTSPFQVYGRGGPSFNERVTIRLIGEDGRVISERLTYLLVYPGRAGNFVAQIEFSTPNVAEAARLEVSTQDQRYGRMDHLTTVDLVLLSAGSARIHPQLDGAEKLAILEPRNGAIVENDFILVRGSGWVDSDGLITVELLDRSGNALASEQVVLDAPAVGQLGSFEVELPFEIPFSQYARVVVYEPASGIPGTVYYSSVEVWLSR